MNKYLLNKNSKPSEKIELKIDDTIEKKENDIEKIYINALSSKELKAYNIAKEHLKTSFTLSKTVGYKKWKDDKGY